MVRENSHSMNPSATEELIRALLNATGQGLYGADLEGNCTFANPACIELLGYESEGDLLGKNMHQLVHHTRSDGQPYLVDECKIYQAFREGRGVHVADELVWRSDGTCIPVEYWSEPLFLRGELSGCVVAFVDVTDTKRAEGELRESEETVRALLDATGEGIYGVDLDGNCTFANPFCVQLLGYESDGDLLGRNMHATIHHTRANGDPYPAEECHIYEAFRAGKGVHVGDEIVWRADGTAIPVEYWSSPMFVRNELTGCVVAFVDITERKRREEELRQTEKLSALGRLSAGLAHELNNPAAAVQRASSRVRDSLEALDRLTASLNRRQLTGEQWLTLERASQEVMSSQPETGLGQIERADREDALASWLSEQGVDDPWEVASELVDAGLDEGGIEKLAGKMPQDAVAEAIGWLSQRKVIKELLETIGTGTQAISELVGAVKEYSYMDRAPEQEVDIHDGLETTLRILSHRLGQDTRLVREYDHSLPRVVVPGGELNQVWTNLIDNALDAVGAAGEVRIRTYGEEDGNVVEIADNGPGIPSDIQSRIFDPFFTTKEVGLGTGLGLDVARRIVVERCGGRIQFSSRPGETRFSVWIPRKDN